MGKEKGAPVKKLYVGGMPYDTVDEDIHAFFGECGTIADIDRVMFADTGRFKGLAFITFKTETAAKKALALDGADMGGRYLSIKLYEGKEQPPMKPPSEGTAPAKTDGCLTAYIGNLSWDIDEDTVRGFFEGCNIQAVRFVEDKETGEFKGFGHVDFADDASLEKAISLNQQKALGRPMKVAYSVVKGRGEKRAPPLETPAEVVEEVTQVKGALKGKGCFICGLEGHKSFDCPQNKGQRGGNKRQK